MKKLLISMLCVLLVLSMIFPLASCNNTETEDGTKEESGTEGEQQVVETFEGDFTYLDSVTTLSGNWNPHTYQTSDESYPIDFITSGLYRFYYNDKLHPVEGKKDYEGYVILPEMAAEMPVDVTEKIKALEGNPYNIPEGATKGYAYEIALNPAATWQNGEKITADDYIYSMSQVLDPKMANYRASDYLDGDFSIANGVDYNSQGSTKYFENQIHNAYEIADLVKGDDGIYRTKDGNKMYVAVSMPLSEWLGGNSLAEYVGAYGDAYFDTSRWDELVALANDQGCAPLTDDTLEMLRVTVAVNPAWNETDGSSLPAYLTEAKEYADGYSFDKVGIFKNDDYKMTIVLSKSLSGFYLLYNLSGNWLVYKPYYEANKSTTDTGAVITTYNHSVESTMSYGPYILDMYQADKAMHFSKNENWFGYTDGKHIYVDPEDGKTYPMYQTTAIDTTVMAEAETRKMAFLQGKLMGYGLQSEDFDQYRNSEWAHATPSETIFFFIFNGYLEAIQTRENNEGFDKTKNDLETLTLTSFRKAIAVTYDKEALCTAVSPARSGGYGLIGSAYLYDPETGARYRDTEQAKKALCEFYSVDVSKFANLDEACDSITGYDPEAAKKLFGEAFAEALEKGYITSADGKTSDQTISIEYASSAHSNFIEKTLKYLNEKLAEVLVGTPFEGKIEFVESAPLGDEWSNNIKAGMSDTVLGGWSGSALNPFGLSDLYVNPNYQYDAKWFNAATVNMTLTVNGEELTMNIKQWSDALNGTEVAVGDKTYNFGADQADVETRLDILAGIESKVLMTYDYIPMLQDGSMALLSKQVYYVVEEYNPVMGRGGISYMKYNYNDTEWAAYVAEQGGTLTY